MAAVLLFSLAVPGCAAVTVSGSLDAAAALMQGPDDEISEEEGKFLELPRILNDEIETRAHPHPKAEPHKMLA